MNDDKISKLIEQKQFKPYLAFLKLARDCLAKSPTVSYWALYYIVEKSIEDQQTHESKDMEFRNALDTLVTILEAEKKARGKDADMFNEAKAKTFIDNYGNQLLLKGDNEVGVGVCWKLAKKLYIAAYTTLQILALFGDNSELNSQRIKYCKFKAVTLDKEIREFDSKSKYSVTDEKTHSLTGSQEKDDKVGIDNTHFPPNFQPDILSDTTSNNPETFPQVTHVNEFDMTEPLSQMSLSDTYTKKAVFYCKNAIQAIYDQQIDTAKNCLKDAIHHLEKNATI